MDVVKYCKRRKNSVLNSILNLDDDILVIIFTRLSITTILSCKRVCKSFYILLSSRYFAQSYQSNPPFTSLICHRGEYFSLLELDNGYNYSLQSGYKPKILRDGPDPVELELSFKRMTPALSYKRTPEHRFLVGSCNGFFCYSEKKVLYISNPFSRTRFRLPERVRVRGRFCSRRSYGFGFCTQTQRYKIVELATYAPPSSRTEVHVLTVGIDKLWRRVHCPFQDIQRIIDKESQILQFWEVNGKGALHWIVNDCRNRPDYLYSFDISEEKVRPIPPPVGFNWRYGSSPRLLFMHGCLCLVDMYLGPVEFWCMTDYMVQDSWTPRIIPQTCFPESVGSAMCHSVASWRNEEILMIHYRLGIVSYNLEQNILSGLHIAPGLLSFDAAAVCFVPNFFSYLEAGTTKAETQDDTRKLGLWSKKLSKPVFLPEINYELYDRGHDHVANHLLRREDRGIITCKQYTNKMLTWRLDEELEATRNMIQQTILFPLYKGSYKSANKVLVSAFVERWHPETTSFHMPFGEATITLDDVQQLLGIPIIGKPMGEVKWRELGPLAEWIAKLIGIDVELVKVELEFCGFFSVRTSWIIKNLSRRENRRCKASPEQITRGFLLVLLRCTLFQDMSGDKVKVKYLYYLQDLKRLDKWAWGVGTLANLYRMLSKASTYVSKGVGGYLTLLEAWIYERCPKQRPQINNSFKRDDIKTRKWKPSFHMADDAADNHLKFVRRELDSMTNEDFDWTPYRRRSEDPHEVAWFCGCLVIDKIEEPYHPNRVVRQFGRVQDKPKCPILAHRGYLAKFNNRAKDFEEYHRHLMPKNFRGSRAKKNGQCTKEYDEWYQSVALVKLNHELHASVFASAAYEERKALDLVTVVL